MPSHSVTIEPLGATLSCREDQTILDACLREGIWLPHACTHGTCGTCKAVVVEGSVDHGDASPYALLDSEKEEGAALLCVARPRSDSVIEGEVDLEEGVEVHPVRDHGGQVVANEEVAPDVRRVVIELDQPMTRNAGQYVQLRLPNGETRPYSVANSPQQPTRIELHIKRSPGGAASDGWIFPLLKAGDRVEVSGPYGQFSWRPARSEPVLLLGSGTGLAPLKAMLVRIAESDDPPPTVLYHGVRARTDLYEQEWLVAFAAEHPWFDYRPALSGEEWEGRQGRIPAQLGEDFPKAGGHVAYICGSPDMADDTIKALMRARLFPRDIYREDFFDSADRASGRHVVRSPLIRR